MAQKVQRIYRDNPGALPASYTLDPGLDLVLSSVVARFNGAAAGATFVPVLEVLYQDGSLMARVRPDQEFAVGDTGVVTYAPFLRRQAAAAAVTTAATYIRRETFTGQAIGTGAFTAVNINTGTTINKDATRFGINAGIARDTDVKLTGRYGFKAQVKWSPVFAGNTWLQINSSLWGWNLGTMWAEPGGAAGPDGTAVSIYTERDLPGGTTTFELQVRQDSGASQTLAAASFEIAYTHNFTDQGADADSF